MLDAMGHTIDDSDLDRMGFRPVLDERDFPDRALSDRFVPNVEIRAPTAAKPLRTSRPSARSSQAPTGGLPVPAWWSSVPAILKGWVHRVLSFAHVADTEGIRGDPYLRGKKAMLVTTLEAPEEVYAAGSQGGMRELLARSASTRSRTWG